MGREDWSSLSKLKQVESLAVTFNTQLADTDDMEHELEYEPSSYGFSQWQSNLDLEHTNAADPGNETAETNAASLQPVLISWADISDATTRDRDLSVLRQELEQDDTAGAKRVLAAMGKSKIGAGALHSDMMHVEEGVICVGYQPWLPADLSPPDPTHGPQGRGQDARESQEWQGLLARPHQ